MAKLMLIGKVAQVELTCDDEAGEWIATCALHAHYRDAEGRRKAACTWTYRFGTVEDAADYASDHADGKVH